MQWDEVRTGGSYISSSDPRLHFGFEQRKKIDLIEVHWPDGRVETVRDAPINFFITIQEGKGIVKQTPHGK